MLYPFAVTLLSINKFLCVCVSVRNSDIAGLSVVNKRCNLHVRENRITALSPTLLAIYLSLLYHTRNKKSLPRDEIRLILICRNQPVGILHYFSAEKVRNYISVRSRTSLASFHQAMVYYTINTPPLNPSGTRYLNL